MKHNASICGSVVGSSFCRLLLGNKKNIFFIKNLDNSCEYVPGTPGGPWSQEELLAVRAKLWRLYTNDYVYKLSDLFDKFGLPAPLNSIDLSFFPAKVLRLSFHDCIRYEGRALLNAHSW